jgi:Spy/CpxP family protein refolding chaperone
MKNKYMIWIVLSLVVAFAAGLVGGIFGERYIFQKRHARGDKGSAHFPSLEQMALDLGLSADQQEQIRKIFERNEAKLKELRADMHGRLRSIRAEVKNEIDKVLTAEQRQKIETMIEKHTGQGKKKPEERSEKQSQNKQGEKTEGDVR